MKISFEKYCSIHPYEREEESSDSSQNDNDGDGFDYDSGIIKE